MTYSMIVLHLLVDDLMIKNRCHQKEGLDTLCGVGSVCSLLG